MARSTCSGTDSWAHAVTVNRSDRPSTDHAATASPSLQSLGTTATITCVPNAQYAFGGQLGAITRICPACGTSGTARWKAAYTASQPPGSGHTTRGDGRAGLPGTAVRLGWGALEGDRDAPTKSDALGAGVGAVVAQAAKRTDAAMTVAARPSVRRRS